MRPADRIIVVCEPVFGSDDLGAVLPRRCSSIGGVFRWCLLIPFIVVFLWHITMGKIGGLQRIFCSYNIGMRGRPPKKPSDRRENALRIRLTEAERALLDATAREMGLDTSAWVRSELLRIVKASIKKPHRLTDTAVA